MLEICAMQRRAEDVRPEEFIQRDAPRAAAGGDAAAVQRRAGPARVVSVYRVLVPLSN